MVDATSGDGRWGLVLLLVDDAPGVVEGKVIPALDGSMSKVCPGCDGEKAAPGQLLGINFSRISVCFGVRRSFDAGESVESASSCVLLGSCIGVRCRSWPRAFVRAASTAWRTSYFGARYVVASGRAFVPFPAIKAGGATFRVRGCLG
jgi:hypothetical protein